MENIAIVGGGTLSLNYTTTCSYGYRSDQRALNSAGKLQAAPPALPPHAAALSSGENRRSLTQTMVTECDEPTTLRWRIILI